jgi:hypothetical protein
LRQLRGDKKRSREFCQKASSSNAEESKLTEPRQEVRVERARWRNLEKTPKTGPVTKLMDASRPATLALEKLSRHVLRIEKASGKLLAKLILLARGKAKVLVKCICDEIKKLCHVTKQLTLLTQENKPYPSKSPQHLCLYGSKFGCRTCEEKKID